MENLENKFWKTYLVGNAEEVEKCVKKSEKKYEMAMLGESMLAVTTLFAGIAIDSNFGIGTGALLMLDAVIRDPNGKYLTSGLAGRVREAYQRHIQK